MAGDTAALEQKHNPFPRTERWRKRQQHKQRLHSASPEPVARAPAQAEQPRRPPQQQQQRRRTARMRSSSPPPGGSGRRGLRSPSPRRIDIYDAAGAGAPVFEADMWPRDLRRMALLVLLYMMQGVPMGLVMGSLPFLFKDKASYTELGVFSLAGYPYSLKLLWSPIVDAVFSDELGRRKSWVLPIQTLMGLIFLYQSMTIDAEIEGELNVTRLSISFFLVVFLAATQDIAVDGWALSMLSKANVGYAATCQTIGLTIGYFLSFTVFLALNSAEFCNQYLRAAEDESDTGLFSLGAYMRFWAGAYFVVTFGLLFFREDRVAESGETVPGIAEVYRIGIKVTRLPAVRSLLVVLMLAKFGFAVQDSVVPLKLLERGFKRQDLALLVLLEFPFEIIFAIVAGRWSRVPGRVLEPWTMGFCLRTVLSIVGPLIIWYLPAHPPPGYTPPTEAYAAVIAATVVTSFSSSIMFSSMGAFFAKIADESIGGTYATLLNTINNFGGTWPKFFILAGVDWLTVKDCAAPDDCVVVTDGGFPMAAVCAASGIALYLLAIRPRITRLQTLPERHWRVAGAGATGPKP